MLGNGARLKSCCRFCGEKGIGFGLRLWLALHVCGGAGGVFRCGDRPFRKNVVGAREKSKFPQVQYQRCAIEDIVFSPESFDIVLSSLALHYVESFEKVAQKVASYLVCGGDFVFSVEHPVFTAYGSQDWIYADNGEILYFPVDNYYYEGPRQAIFLGEKVVKYHKTLTTYLDELLQNGFSIKRVIEPRHRKKCGISRA